ncbi:MAG: sigma-54 interaction domain-containing protein [Candidatus Rokuibacteriota bacterium]
MRVLGCDVRLTRRFLAGSAFVLAVIPAALFSRRFGRFVAEHHQDVWPALQATARGMAGWIDHLGAGLAGVVLARNWLDLCGSRAMQSVHDVVSKVARTDATVLVLGESGVGKEVVARVLHEASVRRRGPFLKVNCAAIPAELLESEFFGHERGAFTHALGRKRGHFETAQGGTLFLDEVTELPPVLQAKLLHVLQDGEFYRIGGTDRLEADVRVIAATNRDLLDAVRAGEFREDLYYRLDVVEVRIPPLRERGGDLPALVEHFQAVCERDYGRRPEVGPETLALFERYGWPGNVRELETMIRRVAILGSERPVRDELLARLRGSARAGGSPSPDGECINLKEIARDAARTAERAAILTVLARVRWNRTRAAQALGISYRSLLYKLAELGLGKAEPGARDRDSAA